MVLSALRSMCEVMQTWKDAACARCNHNAVNVVHHDALPYGRLNCQRNICHSNHAMFVTSGYYC